MSDEPYIKRELESPTPKRQRLSVVSNAQDMFDLMHQYSPPPASTHHSHPRDQDSRQPQSGASNHGGHSGGGSSHNREGHIRRRPTFSRWERNSHGLPPRSPARLRSPYPPNYHHLRRSPHHGQQHQGLRRSNRHRGGQWQQNQDQHEVSKTLFFMFKGKKD